MEYKDIIVGKPKDLISILDQLRSLSLKVRPKIEEDFYGGKAVQMALYSIGRKDNPTHGIALGKDHCKLFLHHFDKIDLSMYKMEGKGKHSRHIKFFKKVDIDETLLLKILKQIAVITNSMA